jgi:methionyl-tRNA synthetase
VRAANAYVDQQAPWALHKEDPARRDTVLYVLAETIRHLALYIQPYMPDSATVMLDQLVVPADARDFTHVGEGSALTPGTTLPKPAPVFPRFVEEESAN